MGEVLNAIKRENSATNSAYRAARDNVRQGGASISAEHRRIDLANQALKDAPLNDPVAQLRALEMQFYAAGGLTDAEAEGISKSRAGIGYKSDIDPATESIVRNQIINQARADAERTRELQQQRASLQSTMGFTSTAGGSISYYENNLARQNDAKTQMKINEIDRKITEIQRSNKSAIQQARETQKLFSQKRKIEEKASRQVTVNGKVRTFKDAESAEAFKKRIAKENLGPADANYVDNGQPRVSPYLNVVGFTSMDGSYLVQEEKPIAFPGTIENNINEEKKKSFVGPEKSQNSGSVFAKYEGDNPLANFGTSLYNALRYSDAVDAGEIKKPEGLLHASYYASKGLSPFYNIALQLAGDKKTSPTLSETIFNSGLKLATQGKTDTHDPIGDYIRKDPLGTFGQLPAEAALWIVGAKTIDVAGKAVKSYSPIMYQSEKILTNEGKVQAIARSITYNDKPVFSWQNGKLVKGFDAQAVPYEKINASGRDGFEAALGSGIEKEIYYSPQALAVQVDKGIIPKVAEARALAWVGGVEQAKGVTSKVGTLGAKPIEGLTQQQADFIFAKTITGQKEGTIDLVHGSTATKASIPESIQKEAGSSLILGDIDIVPKGKNLVKTADTLIRGYAKDFPLSPGQRVEVRNIGKESANRQLVLIENNKPEKKILEVVLRTSDESKYGIAQGNKILGQKIPFKKSVTVKDYPIKTHTADYQLLTNVKQAVAYQKGSNTLLDIYPSSGRTKDIVRGYWNLKAKAFFKGGDKGKSLDAQAEKIRSLYPGIEFTDYTPEKVLLYSSKVESKAKGVTPSLKIPTVKEPENPFESKVEQPSRYDSLSPRNNLASNHIQARNNSRLDRFNSRHDQSRHVRNSYSNVSSSKNIDYKNSLYGSSTHTPKNSSYSFNSEYQKQMLGSNKTTSKNNDSIGKPFSNTDFGSKKSNPSSKRPTPTPAGKVSSLTARPSSRTGGNGFGGLINNEGGKKLPAPLIIWKSKGSEGKPRGKKKNLDWLGNASETKIDVGYNRNETTYNKSKINKFLNLDRKKRGLF